MTTTNFYIEYKNVSKYYNEVQVLESLDLSVKKGEFLSLLGPSGCGKSTTLNILAGFLHPEKGDVLLEGNSIINTPVYRRGLGMVFQRYTLFPHMNIFDNVAFGLRQRRTKKDEIKQRVESMLELVGLSHVSKRFPSELSGGQQQRIALARTLVLEPKILLMDEPLSSLDANLRQQMQIEIRRIHEELNLTTVYVTHDQEEAFVMSDRIALMNEGRIEQIDVPEVIYKKSKTRFVADFIGNSNMLSGNVIEYQDDQIRVKYESDIMLSVKVGDREESRLPSVGENVELMIREENIRIAKEPEDIPNVIPTKVLRVTFQGASTRYLCQMSDKEFWITRPTAEGIFQEGDEVYACLDPEDITILESSSKGEF